MALRLARNIREGHKVGWLIARRLKIKGMGIQLPCLPSDGEGMGMKGWRVYASALEKRAKGLRSGLHCDLRQQMKKQRVGRGVRLTRMMELDGANIRGRWWQRGCSPHKCSEEEQGWSSG